MDQERGLSEREAQVLALIAEPCTNAEIAQRLGISLHTARSHVASVIHKLGVANRREAVRAWRELSHEKSAETADARDTPRGGESGLSSPKESK